MFSRMNADRRCTSGASDVPRVGGATFMPFELSRSGSRRLCRRNGERELCGLENARLNRHPPQLARHERRPVGTALSSGVLDDLAEHGQNGRVRQTGGPKFTAGLGDDLVELAPRRVRATAQGVGKRPPEPDVRAAREMRQWSPFLICHTLSYGRRALPTIARKDETDRPKSRGRHQAPSRFGRRAAYARGDRTDGRISIF